jgi:hypothetical protein
VKEKTRRFGEGVECEEVNRELLLQNGEEEVDREREGKRLLNSIFLGRKGSVCVRKTDNVVMRQVEGQRQIGRELKTGRDFEKDIRKEKSK